MLEKKSFMACRPARTFSTQAFQTFWMKADTLSQFFQSRIRPAVRAAIPMTIQVTGLANRAVVKPHTLDIRPGRAAAAEAIPCRTMLSRPAPMALIPSAAYIP